MYCTQLYMRLKAAVLSGTADSFYFWDFNFFYVKKKKKIVFVAFDFFYSFNFFFPLPPIFVYCKSKIAWLFCAWDKLYMQAQVFRKNKAK